MSIGSIGDVIFKVSGNDLFTFNGLTRSKSEAYAEHRVLRGKPRVQHVAGNLDTLSLQVVLETSRGETESVDSRIEKIHAMVSAAKEIPLVFGLRYWGLWVLKSATTQHKNVQNGITLSARMALELTEYN